MQCERTRYELQAFLGEELAPEQREMVAAHLSCCKVCAEEADAMKSLGERIRYGLKDWVENGACPADVLARIETQLRPAPRHSPWRLWKAAAGGLAAAAAVLFVLMASSHEFAQQLAMVPILGNLAAQFAGLPPVNATSNVDNVLNTLRSRALELTFEKDGVVLVLHKVEDAGTATRVEYSLKGVSLAGQGASVLYTPQLSTAGGGNSRLISYAAEQRSGEVRFVAVFDAVPPGQALTFAVSQVPIMRATPVQWVLRQDRRGVSSEFGATILSWSQQGDAAEVAVQWPAEKALRLSGWTAADQQGRVYPVQELGSAVTEGGTRTQRISVEAPADLPTLTLTAALAEVLAEGSWQVIVPK